jgi:hypothetical protein
MKFILKAGRGIDALGDQVSISRYQAPVPRRCRRVPCATVPLHVAPLGLLKASPFDCESSLRFAQMALFSLFLASNLASF